MISLFDALYEGHARAVHAYLLGRTGDDERAADLLQETYLRVWRHLDDLRQVPEERQRFWLFSVARNLLNDHYRRQAVRARFEVQAAQEIPSEYRDPAAQEHVDCDTTLDLDAAISRLSEELRTVLAMSLAGGMTSAEIGEALGRPPGTVRYQLAQARSQIAMMLGLACTPDEPQRAKATR